MKITTLMIVFAMGSLLMAAEDKTPITAEEATKKVNETVTVRLVVKAAKNRLEKRGEIYLDSEEDFHSEKNLGIVITKDGAKKFKDAGIADPAEHFLNKTITVTGKVVEKENRPRIEIEDPKALVEENAKKK